MGAAASLFGHCWGFFKRDKHVFQNIFVGQSSLCSDKNKKEAQDRKNDK